MSHLDASTDDGRPDRRRILVVDDEPDMVDLCCETLREEGYDAVGLSSSAEARERIRAGGLDLVVTDLVMGEYSGLDLLRDAGEHSPELPFVFVTAHGSVESAVSAMKEGAFDYLQKPFLPEELVSTVARALAFRDLSAENALLRDAVSEKEGDGRLVLGASPAMKEVGRRAAAVAPTPATVLITGESGTGKEEVAVEIHRRSERADRPMIRINCGAIPEHLLEDELFGHEKGAFTGANARRVGKFEAADGGTLFLDEIAEMSPHLQVKLLRILQEQRFQRLGSNDDIDVDVRVICATNADLRNAVEEKAFREDLYYRLAVVEIHVPPLRERREDIPPLAEELLRRLSMRHAVPRKRISPAALDMLCGNEYPGNVRELRNALEHALVFGRGAELVPEDFPEHLRANAPSDALPAGDPGEPSDGDMSLRAMERRHIRLALSMNDGNMVQTAKQLEISRSTLYSKVKQFGLQPVGESS